MRNYTKFFTPLAVAGFMAYLLHAEEEDRVLEPSAGEGNLIDAVLEEGICTSVHITAVELNSEHEANLSLMADDVAIQDFLSWEPDFPAFNKIIANPPFGNGIDLKAHVEKMLRLLARPGRLVTILPRDYDISDLSPPLFSGHTEYPIPNWAENNDGSTTPIKIVVVDK